MNKKIKAELDEAAAEYRPRNRPWTTEELAVAVEYYGKVPNVLLAKKLGRSMSAVRLVLRDRGLQHG